MGCLYGDGYRDDGAHRAVGHYEQREELYAKEDFTDEDGLKVSELEEKFAELDGWNAESDAAALLSGLGIKGRQALCADGRVEQQGKVRVMLAQACMQSG